MAAPQTKNLHIYTIWSVDNGGNGRAGARATEQPIVFSFFRVPEMFHLHSNRNQTKNAFCVRWHKMIIVKNNTQS